MVDEEDMRSRDGRGERIRVVVGDNSGKVLEVVVGLMDNL